MRVGLGMDIVEIADIEESLLHFGDRYLRRVYTPSEIAACAGGADARRLALHFAAKEAAAKSLQLDGDALDWRSVEIRLPAGGEATVDLSGEAAEAARDAGIVAIAVSVSATRQYATAVVVAEGSATGKR